MDYISRSNSQEIDNFISNENNENENTGEMFVYNADKEQDDNLFDLRENGFNRKEINSPGEDKEFVNLRSSIKFKDANKEELIEEFTDNNFWFAKSKLENLDFLNDL